MFFVSGNLLKGLSSLSAPIFSSRFLGYSPQQRFPFVIRESVSWDGRSYFQGNKREFSLTSSSESNEGMIQAMEAALVLGDIGKSEKARDIFKPYGAKAPDHDDFQGEVMQILEKHPTCR